MAQVPHHIVPSLDNKYVWRSGTCTIALISPRLLTTPAFPIILVAHVAALIVNECVTETSGYRGGFYNLGGNSGGVFVANKLQQVVA